MCPALGKRDLMMNFLYRTQDPMLQALLTQRVLKYIAVTNTFPSPAVSTAYSRVPVVLLVAAVLYSLVFLAKTFLPSAWGIRGKNRDALVSLASRHLLWTKRKPPQDCSHEGRLIHFHAIRIPQQKANILHDFTHYAFPNSRTVR